MEYIKEPWTAREVPPRIYQEVASHKIKDAFGTLIASIRAPYIPAPDALTVEEHLNLWRNTARIVKYAPEMYTLLLRLKDTLPPDNPKYLEVTTLIDKVEGTITGLEVILQDKLKGG